MAGVKKSKTNVKKNVIKKQDKQKVLPKQKKVTSKVIRTKAAPKETVNVKQENLHKKDMNIYSGFMYALSLFGIFGWIISTIMWLLERGDDYVKFHFKQLLTLWIFILTTAILLFILRLILGFIVMPLFVLLAIFALILDVIGAVNAFKGHKKELPVIGHFSKYLKF